MLFAEYRHHRIITLGRDAGEPINCFYDPNGLPNKVIHHPIASDFFPGREDAPSNEGVKMRLIAPDGGNKLATYLTDRVGLVADVDFERHAKGQRGGRLYFDILNVTAIEKLFARADTVGKGPNLERGSGTPSRG